MRAKRPVRAYAKRQKARGLRTMSKLPRRIGPHDPKIARGDFTPDILAFERRVAEVAARWPDVDVAKIADPSVAFLWMSINATREAALRDSPITPRTPWIPV